MAVGLAAACGSVEQVEAPQPPGGKLVPERSAGPQMGTASASVSEFCLLSADGTPIRMQTSLMKAVPRSGLAWIKAWKVFVTCPKPSPPQCDKHKEDCVSKCKFGGGGVNLGNSHEQKNLGQGRKISLRLEMCVEWGNSSKQWWTVRRRF